MLDQNTINIAVPVIVGGIAGMTLSMTGVDKIHDLSSTVFHEKFGLEKKDFSLYIPYNSVLLYTFLLIFGFFITEVIVLGGIVVNSSSAVMAGYVILIFVLAAMLFVYYLFMYNIPPEGGYDPSYNDVSEYPNP